MECQYSLDGVEWYDAPDGKFTVAKRGVVHVRYYGKTVSTAETNVAAQAGDEPMDYAEQLRAAVETVCEGWTLPPGARKTLEAALWAPQVSPRATADVERDAARYKWLMRELGGSISMDLDLDCISEIDSHIDAAIATTKPGA